MEKLDYHTLTHALQELKRERAVRDVVYPKLIAKHQITETQAVARNRNLDNAIKALEGLCELSQPRLI